MKRSEYLTELYPVLSEYIGSLEAKEVTEGRRAVLAPLIRLLKSARQRPIRLNFVCTHNSRRSHLAQIWAQTMAYYFGFNSCYCYSAGTEETALFPKVAETLKQSGFQVEVLAAGSNPVYAVKFAPNEPPITAFSKTLAHPFNPQDGFVAIMTCSQADEGCPLVLGAEERIAITYQDPKVSDGTPEQDRVYLERSRQIAAEMLYVFAEASK